MAHAIYTCIRTHLRVASARSQADASVLASELKTDFRHTSASSLTWASNGHFLIKTKPHSLIYKPPSQWLALPMRGHDQFNDESNDESNDARLLAKDGIFTTSHALDHIRLCAPLCWARPPLEDLECPCTADIASPTRPPKKQRSQSNRMAPAYTKDVSVQGAKKPVQFCTGFVHSTSKHPSHPQGSIASLLLDRSPKIMLPLVADMSYDAQHLPQLQAQGMPLSYSQKSELNSHYPCDQDGKRSFKFQARPPLCSRLTS
eukprot:1293766-Amphidinium_carterae.1